MNVLSRFVCKNLIAQIVLIMIGFSSTASIVAAFFQEELIRSSGIASAIWLAYVLVAIVTFLPTTLPLALGFAINRLTHRWHQQRTLIIWSNAGLSPLQIATPFLWSSIAIIIFMAGLHHFVFPKSASLQQEIILKISQKPFDRLLETGRFNTFASLTFFSSSIKDNRFQDVVLERKNEKGRTILLFAESLRILEQEGVYKGVFDNGSYYTLPKKGEKNPDVLFFKQNIIDFSNAALSDQRPRDISSATALTTTALLKEDLTEKHNFAELHTRFILPLINLTIVIFSLHLGLRYKPPRKHHNSSLETFLVLIFYMISTIIIGRIPQSPNIVIPLYIILSSFCILGYMAFLYPNIKKMIHR